MIERYVRDYLRSVTAITDRVDRGVDLPGLYAGNAPQKHRGPCIITTDVTSQHNYALSGEVSPRGSMVQIACYDENQSKAYSLAELVRNRLSGFYGLMGDNDETRVLSTTIVSVAGADQDTPEDSSDKWIYSYTRDYEIIYTTAVPTLT